MPRVPKATFPTVLVVEDDAFVRLNISEAFTRAGWTVVEVASGEEAIHLAKQDSPIDVLFTDIRLAGRLTGWDVGEAFRAADGTIPVVYASGAPVLPMRKVPGSVYFDKPYDPTEVLDTCTRLIRN